MGIANIRPRAVEGSLMMVINIDGNLVNAHNPNPDLEFNIEIDGVVQTASNKTALFAILSRLNEDVTVEDISGMVEELEMLPQNAPREVVVCLDGGIRNWSIENAIDLGDIPWYPFNEFVALITPRDLSPGT